jgi:hypothetical protein
LVAAGAGLRGVTRGVTRGTRQNGFLSTYSCAGGERVQTADWKVGAPGGGAPGGARPGRRARPADGAPAGSTHVRPEGTCELRLDGRIAGIYPNAGAAEAALVQFRRVGVCR